MREKTELVSNTHPTLGLHTRVTPHWVLRGVDARGFGVWLRLQGVRAVMTHGSPRFCGTPLCLRLGGLTTSEVTPFVLHTKDRSRANAFAG